MLNEGAVPAGNTHETDANSPTDKPLCTDAVSPAGKTPMTIFPVVVELTDNWAFPDDTPERTGLLQVAPWGRKITATCRICKWLLLTIRYATQLNY